MEALRASAPPKDMPRMTPSRNHARCTSAAATCMPTNPSNIQTNFAWMKAKARADEGPADGASGTGNAPKIRAGGMKGIGRYPNHPVIKTARIKA